MVEAPAPPPPPEPVSRAPLKTGPVAAEAPVEIAPAPQAHQPQPPPQRPAARGEKELTAEAKLKAERYENFGKFDLRILGIFDFASPSMQGGELDIAFSFVRGRAARFGLSVGFAVMTTLYSTPSARTVYYMPLSLFFGVRLGLSDAELLFRLGALPLIGVAQYGTSRNLFKMSVGTELFVALSDRGIGLTFGFDVFFLAGANFVPRLGLVL